MVKICDLYWRKGKLGISIHMYVFPGEHNPAHFHVYAQDGDDATVSIKDCEILSGSLRTSDYKEVFTWWEKHRSELEKRWQDCAAQIKPEKIDGKVD